MAADAVRESLAAMQWLRQAGARQFYFKYCSTFDSTAHGNIGPVAEAMMAALGTDFAIACPAFPENGRTIFRGHLFVGDQLLSDSGMRDHPLTPMTDANLVRVLQAQSRGLVGLLRYDTVRAGVDATRGRIAALRAEGVRLAVADAIDNDDLRVLAQACADLPLLTAAPEELRAVQAELGAARAGELVEHALAEVAAALVQSGVRRLVVAGGETSGAVVQALGVRTLRIGPAICPGVPWTQGEGRPLKLALKSGNFGGPDFFAEALAHEGGA
jgi:uncharacterized protein YgbK (DUF1537 family)